MSRHDDAVRLRHMLDAAREAAGKVSPDYQAAHSEVPWQSMEGLLPEVPR